MMVLGEKLRLFTQKGQNAHRSLIVAQRQGVKASVAALLHVAGQILGDFLWLRHPARVVLVGSDRLFLTGHPLHDFPQSLRLRSARHFGLTRHRTQDKMAAIKHTDRAAMKGEDRGRLVDHRRQDVVQVERGGEFPTGGEQRVQVVDPALRLEEVGVMKRDGGLLADAGKEEEVIFIEGRALSVSRISLSRPLPRGAGTGSNRVPGSSQLARQISGPTR